MGTSRSRARVVQPARPAPLLAPDPVHAYLELLSLMRRRDYPRFKRVLPRWLELMDEEMQRDRRRRRMRPRRTRLGGNGAEVRG